MAKQHDSSDCQTSRDVEIQGPAEGTSRPFKIAGNKYYVLFPEKTLKCHEDIISLLQQMPGVEEVKSVMECDVIVVFCTVISRAGTNIEVALNKLNTLSDSKPAIFMVFHHTFDPEKTVPDSSRCVNRTDTLTVDILFHEDEGFLACVKNTEAQDRIQKWLQPQETGSWLSWFCSPRSEIIEEQQKIVASSHADEPDQTVASELVICLLGISGSGKTAGNFILGKEERSDVSTATQEITVERGTVAGHQMCVIFTPDWFNSLEEMKQIIQTCIRLGIGGPYAFLLVIPVKQLTEKEKNMLEYMEKIFEENSWKRVMLLFTITDEQGNQNMFIQQENLKSLMEKCGNRFNFHNTNQIGNATQVAVLLKNIKEMAGGKRVSSDVSERSEFEEYMEEDYVCIQGRAQTF